MTFEQSLAETTRALAALAGIRPAIDAAGELVIATLRGGHKLLICGNGGSAAEAAHFSTELLGRFRGARRSLPAVSLVTDGTLLSCIGNDFGFEHVFARQIAGLAAPGDLVVAISSSGNSPNILAALREAQRLGLRSLSLLGRGGGPARGLATCELIVPGEHGPAAQECHLFLIHHLCELVEEAFP